MIKTIVVDAECPAEFSEIKFTTCRGFISLTTGVKMSLENGIITLIIFDDSDEMFETINIELEEVFSPSEDFKIDLSNVPLAGLLNPRGILESVVPQLCQLEFIVDDAGGSVRMTSLNQTNHCMTSSPTADFQLNVAKQFLKI
jgi:hypothetical protein